MIYALEHARELNVRNALLHTDSKLIEDSVNSGRVKMLNLNLIDNMEILEQSFDLMFVKWVPRDKNIEANQHAQQALYKLINKKNRL